MLPFQPYKSLDDTSLTIIDDADQLKDLLEKLKMVREIAIDLEVRCNWCYIHRPVSTPFQLAASFWKFLKIC